MLQQRLTELIDFLASFRAFWSGEVIDQYPDCFSVYPESWVSHIADLSADELFRLEHQHEAGVLSEPELRSYYQNAWRLSALPSAGVKPARSLGNRVFFRISGKKRHEIEIVGELVAKLCRKHAIDSVVDFGGGIGYLAQILAHHYSIRTITIDLDPALQAAGRKRHRRCCPPEAADLEYLGLDCRTLHGDSALPGDGRRLLLGLHTCGGLAAVQLQAAVKERCPVILNFSCCYHKLVEGDFFLSGQARRSGLRLSSEALTLASRSPRCTREQFDFSKRVKGYRYLIHLYLYHEIGLETFISLGNSPRRLYAGSFEDYGWEQLRRLGYAERGSKEQLRAFAADPSHQYTLRRMMSANIIRAAACRPLELLLLFDRAVWLEEQGYSVSLAEYFNDLISPRNIGLLAH